MRSVVKSGVAAVLVVSGLSFADMKVGYIDMQRALGEITEGRAARDRLKADGEKKKREIEQEQNELRKDKEMLDKQAQMMSDEARNKKFTELQGRFTSLMQRAEKMQMELAQAEQVELRKIYDRMQPIVESIAVRESLTLVFERTDSGLVYAPPSLDLTNEVVRTYNDKFKATAAGGTAAPAGKKKDVAAAKPQGAAPAPK